MYQELLLNDSFSDIELYNFILKQNSNMADLNKILKFYLNFNEKYIS
jgi:hypothetical protein